MILLEDILVLVEFVAIGLATAAIFSIIAIYTLRYLRSRSLRELFSDLLDAAKTIVYVLGILLLTALGIFAGPLGLIWWFIVLFIVIEAARKYRASQQWALLWLLTVSAERSMPLAPAVAAFARERGGRFGRRAKQLADLLSAGVSLPDALQQVRGLLPPHAMPMIRVGAESGALAPALHQAAADRNLYEPIWMAMLGRILYLMFVLGFGTSILLFVMLKIVPRYQKIFQDYGALLPAMTRMLFYMNPGGVFWLALCLLSLVALSLLCYATMRYWGWIHWDLPGVARLVRRFDAAAVLDSLALVARQQRPLSDGIASLANSYPKRAIRRRLKQAETDVRAGRDWCESLRQRGLLQAADVAVLQAAQRVGNLAWAMQEMANSGRRRLAYRLQAMIQVVFPAIVVLAGMVVMFVVVALFLPLVSLIQRLA